MTDICWFGNMSNITLCMDICVIVVMPALTAMAVEWQVLLKGHGVEGYLQGSEQKFQGLSEITGCFG